MSCCFVFNVYLGYRVGPDRFYSEGRKPKTSSKEGWEAGALYQSLLMLTWCIGCVR